MDMHLTGRFMDAADAEPSALVSRVVPAKKLKEEALGAATKIAEKSQLAAVAAKACVNQAFETPLEVGLELERQRFYSLFSTEDQKEGMAAFVEKREPQFRDR
jgi:enoyl-CoA hydratase